MSRKDFRPEDIIAKLRDADVLLGQGKKVLVGALAARSSLTVGADPHAGTLLVGDHNGSLPLADGTSCPLTRGSPALLVPQYGTKKLHREVGLFPLRDGVLNESTRLLVAVGLEELGRLAALLLGVVVVAVTEELVEVGYQL
jgi:hypothetical protein